MNRKDFVKTGGLAAAAMMIIPGKLFAAGPDQKVRLAMIGVGARGQDHLELLLARQDVELVAICVIDDRALKASKQMIIKSGKKNAPGLYRR